MSLNENKAGGAAVDPDDYNEVVDAVVALQAASSGGSLPDGWTANDPTPGDLTVNGNLVGIGSLEVGPLTCSSLNTGGGSVATGSGALDLGGGNVDNAYAGNFDDAVKIGGALNHDGAGIGFYGTTPIAKQTGVAVDAASIHAALVALGLIDG